MVPSIAEGGYSSVFPSPELREVERISQKQKDKVSVNFVVCTVLHAAHVY